MRAAVLLMLLVSPLLLGPRAAAAKCRPVWMEHTAGDGRFLITVPKDELRRSPAWRLGDGEPPLPPWRAAKTLQDWAAHAYADQGGATINVIELRQGRCRAGLNRWYYSIQYAVGAAGDTCCARNRFAVVLMDGRLFPPGRLPPSGASDPD
jgi:hypothetical protein